MSDVTLTSLMMHTYPDPDPGFGELNIFISFFSQCTGSQYLKRVRFVRKFT
jgi:hypothetical protein